jgi:hypothetical protein
LLKKWNDWIEEVEMKRKVTAPFDLKPKLMVSGLQF